MWKPTSSGNTTAWMPVVDINGNPTWGWQAPSPTGNTSFFYPTIGTCLVTLSFGIQVNIPLLHMYGFAFSDVQGSVHPFPNVDLTDSCVNSQVVRQPTQPGNSFTSYAPDSSGYFISMNTDSNGRTGVVTGPDGTQYISGSLEDRNGNLISQNTPSSTVSTWTDSTGQPAITVTKSASAISYTDANGSIIATVNLQSIPVRTNFGCPGIVEYSGTATVPASIALPDGTSFSFIYEDTPGNPGFFTGRLKTITLLDGGSYQYGYIGPNDGISCSDGSTIGLTRLVNDGTSSQVWTFSRAGNQSTATFPKLSYDTSGNSIVYAFDANGHETTRKVYQGTASGALLRTVNTTWAANGTPATVVNILEDGSTRAETDTTYDSNGILQNISYYDFGVGGHGPLIKSIVYSYLNSSNYITRNLIALPSEIQVKDGGGNVRNRVDFNYDENGSLTSCPTGISQHDDNLYGCGFVYRGNLTSMLTYKDPATPANPVTRGMTYDVFGNVLLTKLNGIQETSNTFSSATNYSFPDTITSGPPGWPQLSNSYVYDGAFRPISTTDITGQTTQYSYDDLGRISTITRPDLAQISYNYDSVNRTTTVTTPIDATHAVQQVTAVDTLGRVTTSTLLDGNGNAVTTSQNRYDELGRLSGRSNPYVGSPDFFTTSQFDALGRVKKTILPDGQLSTYDYSLQTAIFTDPTGKQIKDKSDALGRLIEVDQPDTTATGGTSASASVLINGVLNVANTSAGISATAKTGSPLTSVVSLPDGSSHVFYIDTNQHISHLSWTSTNSWQVQDISYITGSTAVATNSSLTSVALSDGSIHIFFEGPDQHIYQLFSVPTWGVQDITAITGNTLAAAGSALASDSGAAGEPVHLYYVGTNQHVYCLFISNSTSTWQNQDLTAATGNTLAASSTKLSVALMPDGTTRLFYLGTNQHVYQLLRNNGGSFGAPFLATSDFADAQSWNLAGYYPSIRLGDVNGDGKADVCGRSSFGVICGLNNGSGTFSAVTQWESNMTDAFSWNLAQYTTTLLLGDVNGGGKADLCGRGSGDVLCEPSSGTNFGAYIASPIFTDAQGWGAADYYYGSLRLGDVNGDGSLDLCGRGSAGISCALNTGNGSFSAPVLWGNSSFTDAQSWNQSQYGTTIMLADINGDGKADVCGRASTGIVCALSTGSGFGQAYLATSDFSDLQGWNAGSYYYGSIRLADVNGDGKPDICGRSSGGVICGLNNGNGSFGPVRQWEGSFTDAAGWNQPQYGSTMMFADINGDGRPDVCGRGGAGIICELSVGNATWQNQDLTAITGNTLAAAGTTISLDPGAPAGSPGASGGGMHAYYLGSNQHIYALTWNTTSLSWQNLDLTAITINGTTTTSHQPAAVTPLTGLVSNDGYVRLYFLDASQHIHETFCCNSGSWIDNDMMNVLGVPATAVGTVLTSTGLSAGNSVHLYYQGSTQHINHMYYNSTISWANQDLSNIATTLVPDSGTVSLTVGGFTGTACFGPSASSGCATQQQNISSAEVATALVQALNVSASPVTATANGNTIALTWKTVGPTNAVVHSLATSHDNSNLFGTPSFTSPATNFAGGSSTSFNTALVTTYAYNTMDQVTSIVQGSQVRSASYDALGRMTSHVTPESGTVSMQYNDVNQVTQKTDARNVVTQYTYDGLHRLTGKSYTVPNGSGVVAMQNVCDPAGGPTPTANTCFFYDQGGTAAFAMGQITKEVDSSGSETYSYDQLGQMTQRSKIVNGTNNGNPFTIQYQYNLSGEITQIQYPSGRQVRPAYDAIGRLAGISDGAATYASSFTYGTAQQLTGFTYGNGTTAGYGFSTDGLLQLKSIQYARNSQPIFSLSYGYIQNGANNGQITSISDNVEPGRSATYLYDVLGRLKQAYTAGSTSYPKWDLAFGYDPYGNRTNETPQSDTSPNALVPSNQIAMIPGTNWATGLSYDASGNTTNDGLNALVYDGESHVISSASAGVTTNYVSDAGGVRVRKCQPNCTTPTSSTVYIFSGNEPIAEYDNGAPANAPSREFVYSPAGLLASLDASGTKYHLRDHLSPRMITDSAGNTAGQQGHFPFGELWYSSNTTTKRRFTNYENDPESGNDYAMARFYINRLCRFNSPDALGGTIADPRSLNRYAYASNDPINITDPLGLAPCNMNALVKGGQLSAGQLKSLTKELNRIFGTGGADIHVNITTSGPGDFTLDIDPQNPAVTGQFTFGNTAPGTGLFARTVSEIYQSRINTVGASTDGYHTGWSGFSSPAVGQGVVYGRIIAHEMAGHGMLGFSHADPQDSGRGFLGQGSQSSADLFHSGSGPNSTFSFSAQQGLALHVWCILRTQKFDPLPVDVDHIDLVDDLRGPLLFQDLLWSLVGSGGGGQTST
ncbi:MAG: FG-GAP-like repeat-containing protein [Acidobacteriia bacterium]|nr:FG-GAP-like repeat-containing protein [Terriglobia bacterium]